MERTPVGLWRAGSRCWANSPGCLLLGTWHVMSGLGHAALAKRGLEDLGNLVTNIWGLQSLYRRGLPGGQSSYKETTCSLSPWKAEAADGEMSLGGRCELQKGGGGGIAQSEGFAASLCTDVPLGLTVLFSRKSAWREKAGSQGPLPPCN